MKRPIAISVLLSVGFVLGIFWKELTVHAAGDGVVPVGNGDVNGDGTIDLSDGVYVLNWLFMGGPAPEPFVCPPPGVGALPATGQTGCYDRAGDIPCDSVDFPGQDGFYNAGCPSEDRFVDNGDDTVSDTCTGLMWQKDTADVNGDGTMDQTENGSDTLIWGAALKYCEGLSFAGHDDWRLPNVRELQSIVDYGRELPSIDPVFGAVANWHWSSSPYVSPPSYAWFVFFGGGNVNGYDKNGRHFVRAVRNAE